MEATKDSVMTTLAVYILHPMGEPVGVVEGGGWWKVGGWCGLSVGGVVPEGLDADLVEGVREVGGRLGTLFSA